MNKILRTGHGKILFVSLLAGLALLVPLYVSAQSEKLTFSMDNATLKEIFGEIQRICDYDFVYSDADIANVSRKTLKFNNATIEDVMSDVLSGTGLRAKVDNSTIVVRKTGQPAQQRNRIVTGTVLDMSGKPKGGVSVVLKGTTSGIATDAQGRYRISIPDNDDAILVFSCVGMETQEIRLGKQTAVNVTMLTKTQKIQEVVVTGIFERSVSSYTGSITRITAEELDMFRGQNLIRTIANIDPSLNITIDNLSGSNPNTVPEISIRGNSSIPRSLEDLNQRTQTEINTPLIIMDGFPISISKLMDFNDENVNSITILKDASATAIYGSQGANGVIVITTKRPTPGSLRINFKTGLNIEIPDLTSYNLMNAEEKLQLELAAGLYNAASPLENNELQKKYFEKLAEIERGVDTYWLSQPLRVGVGQKYTLGLQYGDERFQLGVDLMYNNIMGVMIGSERNTFSGGLTLMYEHKSLRFRNQLSLDFNKSNESPYGARVDEDGNLVQHGSYSGYVNMNPYWRIYDENGNMIKDYESISGSTRIGNPLMDAQLGTVDQSKYTNIINNFEIQWKILDELSLTTNIGFSKYIGKSDFYLPPSHSYFTTSSDYSGDNSFRRGLYIYSVNESTTVEGNVRLDYSKSWNNEHRLVAGFNMSVNHSQSESAEFRAEGYTTDYIAYMPNALQYAQNTIPSGSENTTRSVGFTGNVNYSFRDKYYADFSYRSDGSSIYGVNHRFAPFWSFGVGWNIHNEALFRDSRVLNRFKLRYSLGETGAQNFEPYQALSTFVYSSTSKYVIWQGAKLAGLSNPDLKWQTTFQHNAGIELGFFNDRLFVEFDYYVKTTDDLLAQMDLPYEYGYSTYMANVGKVENRGFENTVRVYIIKDTQREITWMVSNKIAHNKNTILELSPAIKARIEAYKTSESTTQLLYEGHSLNSIYVVPSLGIDPSTGREILLDKDGNISGRNGIPGYSNSAREWAGVTDPKYRGNINSYLQYKNFALSLSFAYHWGGQQYNETLQNRVEVTTAQMEYNVDKRVYTDRWKEPGDHTFFKGFDNVYVYRTSRFVMDDNVFQLQTIGASYRWRTPFVKRMGVDVINFSFNMSDVLYFSSIERERGIDYPFSQKVSLSISLQF